MLIHQGFGQFEAWTKRDATEVWSQVKERTLDEYSAFFRDPKGNFPNGRLNL